MNNPTIELKIPRRLIYVDAAGIENNSIFKISIYDKENGATHTLQLKDIEHNTLAEKYAIYHAILYIRKHGFKRCHILCDNQSAVTCDITKMLSKKYSIGISWIPREANIIADKISKLDPTQKEEEWNLLKLFVDLITNQENLQIMSKERPSTEVQKLKKELQQSKETVNKRNTKISNQSKQINNLREKIKTD
jgi:hypothetical protein